MYWLLDTPDPPLTMERALTYLVFGVAFAFVMLVIANWFKRK